MAVRSVGTARLEVVPDLGGFQKKLASGIRGMRDVTIPVKADTAKAENKLAGLTKGKTTEVKAEADTGKAENKLGGLSKARTVSIGAQADTARAQSELSAVSKDRQVKFFGVSDFTGVQSKVQSVTKWASEPLKFTGTFDGGPVKAGVASTSATVGSAATSMGSRLSSALSSGANRAGSAIRSSMNGAASAISSLHGPITRIGGAFAGLAGASAIFGAGFKRLNDIQRAEVMFHSIGLTASQTKAQMKQLSDQVTGTSVSLSDAAKYSAMFAQSGVQMGKPMNDAIHAFTNLSSIAEGSGVDVGRVMQQISAQGKMTGGDLMQMGDAGVNATKYLADSMHMSQADVKKAISDGKVSFQDFVTAINQGTGDLGKEMGETLPAKLSNMKTAFANLGASILEPFVGPITSAVTSLTGALKTVTPVIGAVLGGFVGLIQHCPPLQWALIAVTGAVTALIGAVMAVKIGAVLSSWFTVPEIGAFIGSMMETIGILGLYALEWVKAAGTAVLSAGRIAGAWLMAAPKNLLSISRAFLVMTGGWIKSAAVAVASAAQHAVAWVIAAPKNPLVWARAFATMIAGWGRSAAVALVSAGQHAIAWLLAAPKNMGRMALAFTTMIGGWIKSAAIAMVSAAQIAIAWMISLGPIALVIGAVVAVIGIFVALWRQCEGFRNFFIGMWDGIVAAWNAAIGVFSGSSGLWSGIWLGIVSGAQWVWDVLKGIGDYIGGEFMGALGTLAGWIGTAFNAAASAVMMAWSFMQPVFDWIGQRVSDIVNVVGPVFQAIWGQLQAFGAWIAGWWMGSIQPILDQIGSKISEFVQNHWPIIKMILIALGTVLLAPIVIALGAVAIAIGAVIVVVGAIVAALVGLVDLIVHIPGWVSDMVSAVVNWFRNLWQGIKDACSAAGSAISGWFSEHIAPLPGKIGSKLGEVISWFSRLPGRIKSALGDTGSMLVSAGKDMVRGLINGIESMAGAAMDKAKHLASNVANAFKSALHIHSPSRVFMGFGENIGQGLINGMDSMQSDVANASENLAAAADTTLPPSVQALSDKGAPASPSAVAQPQTQSGSTQTPQDTQGVQGDPSAVFNNMAASLQATADSVLTPMWVGQQGQVTAWGQGVALTASGVVNPAFSSMASFMLATKTGIIDPVMAGLGQNVTNLGTTTQQGVFGVITPTWQQMGANIVNVKTGTIDPAFAGIQGGLNNTVRAFATGATGIANEWNRVREATAAPVRFAINSVFNDGIVGMWNSASELLGTPKMGTYPVRFATGGYVSGPGGPKDDKVPALLSNGEFVMNAKAVNNIGRDNLTALNSGTVGVAPGVFTSAADVKAALNDKTFKRSAGQYAAGGLAEGTPAWKALLRGYNWARSRNGRPYVWGGSADGAGGADCCLVGDTMVYGPFGAKRIDELSAGDPIYSFVDGRRTVETVTRAWFSKRQMVYAVRTRNRTVEASDNHPFMRLVAVESGSGSAASTWGVEWARTDELRRGDLLVSPKSLETVGQASELANGWTLDENTAWLIGMFIGDGSYNRKYVQITKYGERRDRVSRIVEQLGFGPGAYSESDGVRWHSVALARKIAELGLTAKSVDRRVPEYVWQWPEEMQRAFVAGYIDSDGHKVSSDTAKHGEFTFSAASKQLIVDMRALLISLGEAVSNIRVTVRRKPIVIRGRQVNNARDLYGFTVWANGGRSGVVALRRNAGIARWIDSGDFTVSKVLSVDEISVQDTYDIEVAGAHNFIANGIVVHNSGFMSGIADVILGGNGHRQWATMSFPGPQQGAWAPGLAAGFSVGISSEHTAGTIGGAPGMPAVNVESGGINSRMKFGTPDAAGANHSQFPRKYHLIVTDAGTFVPGMGGGASMADIIGGLIKPFKDKMTSAAADWAKSHPGTFNRVPSAIADKLGNAAEKKILALSEEMMGDPGGSGVERWRPMVKRAMAYVGFNANDEAQVNAMLRQIQTESSGNPRASQGIHDVNSGGNEAEGLMQVAKSTWRAYRDPTLPDDWYNPYANMVAALRYYKARYGNNLTTNMGHGIGYDRGGVASGVGFLAKYTQKPERVLSPTQTAAFDRLVTVLERDGVPQGMSQNTVVGQQVTNQYLMNPDDVLRSNRRAMKSALLEGGIRV